MEIVCFFMRTVLRVLLSPHRLILVIYFKNVLILFEKIRSIVFEQDLIQLFDDNKFKDVIVIKITA